MSRKKKARYAFRSKFEERLGADLDRSGSKWSYESETFSIIVPVRGTVCVACGAKEVMRRTRFTPDFFLPRYIVEAKGKFTANDRKRLLALLAERREAKDPRHVAMLFMRDNKLSKTSNTRYSTWCKDNGVEFAIGEFPKEWLK